MDILCAKKSVPLPDLLRARLARFLLSKSFINQSWLFSTSTLLALTRPFEGIAWPSELVHQARTAVAITSLFIRTRLVYPSIQLLTLFRLGRIKPSASKIGTPKFQCTARHRPVSLWRCMNGPSQLRSTWLTCVACRALTTRLRRWSRELRSTRQSSRLPGRPKI